MFGNVATIAGGVALVVSAGARLAMQQINDHVVMFAQTANVPPITGDTVTTGGMILGMGAIVTGLVREWFKHRETMRDSDLQDQLTEHLGQIEDLQAAQLAIQQRAQRAEEERERIKKVLSMVVPVLQEDRIWMIRANAIHPEIPLPSGFGQREFDAVLGTLFVAGTAAMTSPVREDVATMEMIEGRRELPSTVPAIDSPDFTVGANPGD